MHPTTDNEIALIKSIAGDFKRHPLQLNRLFEADGEILDLSSRSLQYLVLKTDGIGEEIREGLYKDPYLIGWMSVTVTMSDLAAVGADAMGILISLQLPKQFEQSWMTAFKSGINDACTAYDICVLGGDTNFSQQVSITTTGVGTAEKPMLRKGITAGDLLYATAPPGAGNGFAYSVFFDPSVPIHYRPVARLKESKVIREFASSCIDTSDGFFPALSVLCEINEVGFELTEPVDAYLNSETKKIQQHAGIPAWIFLAGPHGEYELLFSIPGNQRETFGKACADAGFKPLLLGKATPGYKVSFRSEELTIACYPAEIANMFGEAQGDIRQYFEMLMQQHRQWSRTQKQNPC